MIDATAGGRAGGARRPGLVAWAILLSAGIGAVAFAPAVADMQRRWFAPGSYWAHGPFVPLVSIWAIWRQRGPLRETDRGSNPWGLALVAASIVLLIAGVLADVTAAQNFALVGVLTGTALVLFGGAVVRRIGFAFAYLLWMVPLPPIVVLGVLFRLKLFAAHLAGAAMTLAGVATEVEGSTIRFGATEVLVDETCSGLRTLIVLVAMAAVFAHLERGRAKSVAILLLSVPIAVVANAVRIVLLCALAASGGEEALQGPLHEITGVAVYVVALGMLLGIWLLPSRATPRDETAGARPRSPFPEPRVATTAGPRAFSGPGPLRVAALLVLLLAGAAVTVEFGPSTGDLPATRRTQAVPDRAGGWTGTDVALAPQVFTILGTDDVLYRSFVHPDHPVEVDLYVVHAADSRVVAHPPEICFTGGGFLAIERGATTLPGAGQDVPAQRMLLERRPWRILVYYWFRLDGRNVASYVGHRLGSLFQRFGSDRREGSLVRVSTWVEEDGVEAAEERIADFARDALPTLLGALP